jgi:hypothetical protein
LDGIARFRLAEEVARDDPTIESSNNAPPNSEDSEERHRAIGATRLHIERAARQIAESEASDRAARRHSMLHRVTDSLRAEVLARGGTVVGLYGKVKREDFDPDQWTEVGIREQAGLPRLYWDPDQDIQYSLDRPLRED